MQGTRAFEKDATGSKSPLLRLRSGQALSLSNERRDKEGAPGRFAFNSSL